MTYVTVRTEELRYTALDWAVAKCEGVDVSVHLQGANAQAALHLKGFKAGKGTRWRPSTNWAQGGPIIEMNCLGVWFSEQVNDENGNVLREPCWYCETCCTTDNGDETYQCEIGHSPLIAAMRCYVASKFGDDVEIPKELE